MNLLFASTFSGGSPASSAELVILRNRNGLVPQFTYLICGGISPGMVF